MGLYELKNDTEYALNKKAYVDIEQTFFENGAAAIIIGDENGKSVETVYTGKVINCMPMRNKKERTYEILSSEYDINFIFDDNKPFISFYPVPKLEVFAFDSFGGFFCSKNGININDDDTICYVDKELNCYHLAPGMREFINMAIYDTSWKKRILGYDIFQEKSEDNKKYLIEKLKLSECRHKIEFGLDLSIKIYISYDDAKNEIDFVDIREFISNIDSM